MVTKDCRAQCRFYCRAIRILSKDEKKGVVEKFL